METINNVSKSAQSGVDYILGNPYIMAFLKISLALYGAKFAPDLHPKILEVFKNVYVKILVIALIAYLSKVDFQLSILMAMLFVMIVNISAGRNALELYTNDYAGFLKDKTEYKTLLGEPVKINSATLIESHSDNYSGCEDITMSDLLAVFDNDKLKLQTNVLSAYQSLIQQLPEKSEAKENLIKLAKACGIPYNVEFNDENAKYIATILINYGFKISKRCQAPYQQDMINV